MQWLRRWIANKFPRRVDLSVPGVTPRERQLLEIVRTQAERIKDLESENERLTHAVRLRESDIEVHQREIEGLIGINERDRMRVQAETAQQAATVAKFAPNRSDT